nr:TetR/AcrR family transcriptional regulator C-terminal domain-containing protein [Glycomyces sp. L485]
MLWRQAPTRARRGPRKGLTVDAVVNAAIAVADADGLEAVTMRRVAEPLGVATMTLYTYVPGKSELIVLMLDALYGAIERTEPAGRDWRERLATVARDNFAMYRAHPWAAAAAQNRPPLGPGQCAKYEYELRTMDGTGLTDAQKDDALAFLLAFVRNAAAEAEREASAMSEKEWWEASGPLLAKVLDPERFPTAARVGQAALGAAFDPEHAFEFGLDRALDGLAALIGR